jgi:hypothetical protein
MVSSKIHATHSPISVGKKPAPSPEETQDMEGFPKLPKKGKMKGEEAGQLMGGIHVWIYSNRFASS